MNLVDESDSKMPKVGANIAFSFLNSLSYTFYDGNSNDSFVICPDHNHELLQPTLTSTWMPNAVGSMAGRSAIFAENQVSLLFVCCPNPLPPDFGRCPLSHPCMYPLIRDKFGDLIYCIFTQSTFILGILWLSLCVILTKHHVLLMD